MATASPRVALDLDGVVLDRLWLEGSGQDTATGEAVVEVKLGLRLPLRGLIEALTELQRAHPRTQPDSPPPRAKLPEQPFVVSKTFVEHDQPDSPQRTALLRTSTAPPECARAAPGACPDDGDGARLSTTLRGLGAVEEELESEDAVGHSAGAAGIGCRTATFDPMEHDADDAAERPAWEPPEGAGDPVYPTQAQNELAYTGIPPMYPFVPVPVPVPVPADACHNWFPHWQQPDQPALPTTRPLGTLATDREESPARPRKPEMESLLDDTGLLRVIWNASSRKIERSTDQSLVSPKIQLAIGDATDGVPFTMTIRPKARGDKKGQASFKMANKQGRIELSCNNTSCLGTAAPDMTFSLAVGSGQRRREKGPFTHNFARERLFSVPAAQEDWDFGPAIEGDNEATSTFSVHLEIAKGPWRCLAPRGAAHSAAAAADAGAARPLPAATPALPDDPPVARKRW